jgi:hypothetical protein
MVEPVSDEVNSPGRYREDLIIVFHLEVKLLLQVKTNIRQQLVERGLVRRQDHQIIGIAEIVSNPLNFLEPVIESRQVEIGKILAEIVPDRQAWGAVDDLFQEPKQVLILELTAKLPLQDPVTDGGVKFPDIELEAILGASLITECALHRLDGAMNPFSLDAAIGVRGKEGHEDPLQDIHGRVMDNPVREKG